MRIRDGFLLAGLLVAGLARPAAAAPSAELIAKVSAVVDADTPRLTKIFKDLHQHPEIAFTEVRTGVSMSNGAGLSGASCLALN